MGLEPTTYRFLAGILCHWDTEASLHAFLAHEHEWTGRDSNPQGRKTAGLQPTTLPITFYPSICSPTLASSTLGGTRTHNKPRLKRLPLPIGAPGHELDDDIATTSSGWRGTRTPKARRQLVYSQRRYRLRAIRPYAGSKAGSCRRSVATRNQTRHATFEFWRQKRGSSKPLWSMASARFIQPG